MEKINLSKKKDQNCDNLLFASSELSVRTHIVNYMDAVIRGLLAFFVFGIGSYLILVGFFHMKAIYTLPVIFLVSIGASPFLSKIRLGERVLIKYEKWLERFAKAK